MQFQDDQIRDGDGRPRGSTATCLVVPPGDTTWDCEAGGLLVSQGDLVRVFGVGTAN